MTVSFLRLCVNVDYILLLTDFFVNYELGTPVAPAAVQAPPVPATSTNEKESTGTGLELPAASITTGNDNFAIEIKVESPQFILFENQYELRKSNSFKIDVSSST